MYRTICKSKLQRLKVTKAELYYEGSITIDEALLEAGDILSGEKVEILNLNNGSRVETYAIKGKRNSGVVCLNGPAARHACVGDELIVLAYCFAEDKEAKAIKPKIVYVNARNRIRNKNLR